LGARDTLRIEACLPLYGNELTLQRGPVEAGLAWCCREDSSFIGGDAVRAVRASGPREKLVALRLDAPGIPRQGNPVVGGGEVCSGTMSPCLNAGIGLAYVPAQSAGVGTALEIDVRGRIRPASVVARPFVKRGG
jgi:aminomethyltransferase